MCCPLKLYEVFSGQPSQHPPWASQKSLEVDRCTGLSFKEIEAEALTVPGTWMTPHSW